MGACRGRLENRLQTRCKPPENLQLPDFRFNKTRECIRNIMPDNELRRRLKIASAKMASDRIDRVNCILRKNSEKITIMRRVSKGTESVHLTLPRLTSPHCNPAVNSLEISIKLHSIKPPVADSMFLFACGHVRDSFYIRPIFGKRNESKADSRNMGKIASFCLFSARLLLRS